MKINATFKTNKILRKLTTASKKIAKTTQPLNDAGSYMITQTTRENIGKEQTPEKNKWQPFKAGGRWVGKDTKRRLDKSAKLLQDTGKLRLGVDFLKQTIKYVIIGISNEAKKYAPYQQRMRRFMGFSPKNRKRIKRIFDLYIKDSIKKSGIK